MQDEDLAEEMALVVQGYAQHRGVALRGTLATRDEVLRVPCVRCGAGRGEACTDAVGFDREVLGRGHLDRQIDVLRVDRRAYLLRRMVGRALTSIGTWCLRRAEACV